MIEEKIKAVIRDVPDFPKPGILFKDITSILLDPELCNEILDTLAANVESMDVDVILAIESRGFPIRTI